jgi:hypothetical protein
VCVGGVEDLTDLSVGLLLARNSFENPQSGTQDGKGERSIAAGQMRFWQGRARPVATAGAFQRSQVQILPPLLANPQVIPEGAGPVKSVGRSFFLSPTRCVSAPMRRRGPGSGGARPRSGRRALTASPFGASCSGCRGRAGWWFSSRRRRAWWTWLASAPVLVRWEQAVGCSVIPSPRLRTGGRCPGRHDGVRQSGRSGQSDWIDHATGGGHDLHDSRPTRIHAGSSPASHTAARGGCSART